MSRLAVCEPIACKEASLFEAYALLCPPTSTCYKLLEIERTGQSASGVGFSAGWGRSVSVLFFGRLVRLGRSNVDAAHSAFFEAVNTLL